MIHELVVGGCIFSDRVQKVNAVLKLLEDIGGMNEPLIDDKPVALQIGEFDLQVEDEITLHALHVYYHDHCYEMLTLYVRTRDDAFKNEEEDYELQRKWIIREKQVMEANPHDCIKMWENTVNRLFSGSRSFWKGNTKSSDCPPTSPPPPSSESSLISKSGSEESPAQRSITSYFQIAPKHSPSVLTRNDSSCAMDTDESSNNRSLSGFLSRERSSCEGSHSASSAASGACLIQRGSLERQLTIDSSGGLSASFAPPSSPKTILQNRCHCNTGTTQLQNCADCHKSFCDDCLRVCYKCSKFFCRDCRMNSFLHEKNKTACYQCLC
ncbi:hypothetical protein FHG87_019916 [Trinorchestia longiramus]|nr:hypothetical protein FHG87_019916 [Trinorchestia longiramus]